MESDLKRGDVARKSFRIPQRSKRLAPAPPIQLTTTKIPVSAPTIPSPSKLLTTQPVSNNTTADSTMIMSSIELTEQQTKERNLRNTSGALSMKSSAPLTSPMAAPVATATSAVLPTHTNSYNNNNNNNKPLLVQAKDKGVITSIDYENRLFSNKTNNNISNYYYGTELSTDYKSKRLPTTKADHPLKLSDILKPSSTSPMSVDMKNKNKNIPEPLSPESSLDVLRQLEKRINQMEIDEKIKNIFPNKPVEMIKVKNRYANHENLLNTGISNVASSGTEFGQSDEDDDGATNADSFKRGADGRSSVSGAINKNVNSLIKNTKPVLRTASDTKTVENTVQMMRLGLKNKQMATQRKRDQSPASTTTQKGSATMIGSSRSGTITPSAKSPLSPLTNKKKENIILMEKEQLNAGSNEKTNNTSHSSLLKRRGNDNNQETLRHRITPFNSISDRSSSKDKDKNQVICYRNRFCVCFRYSFCST